MMNKVDVFNLVKLLCAVLALAVAPYDILIYPQMDCS